MPLASLYTLQFYGNCCAAMVVTDAAGSAEIAARRNLSPAINVSGTGTAEMRPYRGRRAALSTNGVGVLYMRPNRSLRAGLRVTVSELSQDDVTGAVLESLVEGDVTLRQAMRLILSALAGNATGLENGSPVFRSLDGSKARITATYAAGTRTVSARDGT
jgi:hypothetical protein